MCAAQGAGIALCQMNCALVVESYQPITSFMDRFGVWNFLPSPRPTFSQPWKLYAVALSPQSPFRQIEIFILYPASADWHS